MHSTAYRNPKHPEIHKHRDPRSFAPEAFHTTISFLIFAHLILLHLITLPTSEDTNMLGCHTVSTGEVTDVSKGLSDFIFGAKQSKSFNVNYPPSKHGQIFKRRCGPTCQKTCIFTTAVRTSNLEFKDPTH